MFLFLKRSNSNGIMIPSRHRGQCQKRCHASTHWRTHSTILTFTCVTKGSHTFIHPHTHTQMLACTGCVHYTGLCFQNYSTKNKKTMIWIYMKMKQKLNEIIHLYSIILVTKKNWKILSWSFTWLVPSEKQKKKKKIKNWNCLLFNFKGFTSVNLFCEDYQSAPPPYTLVMNQYTN